MRRSRKPLFCNRGTGGSNPPLSAKTDYSRETCNRGTSVKILCQVLKYARDLKITNKTKGREIYYICTQLLKECVRQHNLYQGYRRLSVFFLVLLFCGYLGSITFFPHTHIVDSISVVHSHPYKSLPGSNPADHHHTNNEFLLIQFISGFITTVPVLFLGTVISWNILHKLFLNQDRTLIPGFFLPGANRPRAPAA